jgi:hypothetical protein
LLSKLYNDNILTAQHTESAQEGKNDTSGTVYEKGQGRNRLRFFLYDRYVSGTTRETAKSLAEAKLYVINDYPRTLINNTKLGLYPFDLCGFKLC